MNDCLSAAADRRPAGVRRTMLVVSMSALFGCGAADEFAATDWPGAALDAGAGAGASDARGGETSQNGGSGGSAAGGGGGAGPADFDAGLGFADAGAPVGGGSGGAGGGEAPPDAGTPAPPTRDEACAWLAGPGAAFAGPDRDGDCFPEDCVAFDAACARFTDCDDRRPDVNPGVVELCNGRDDDCDGNEDETFDIGRPCSTACGEGKWECALTDPTRTACSTEAGQSQAPPPAEVREVCNEVDDDCDGIIDDDCRFALPEAVERAQPAVCGGRIFVVENGALVEVDRAGVIGTLSPVGDERPVAPACGPVGIAWLSLPHDGGGCETPEGGPERCYGRILGRRFDAAPGVATLEIATAGAHGRPAVTDTEVLWHSVLGQTLGVYARTLAPDEMSRRIADDQSDPASGGTAAGLSPYLATRLWVAGEAQIFLQDRANPRAGLAVTNPLAAPGPPRLLRRLVDLGHSRCALGRADERR